MGEIQLTMLERQALSRLPRGRVIWLNTTCRGTGALNRLVRKGLAARYPDGQKRMGPNVCWDLVNNVEEKV